MRLKNGWGFYKMGGHKQTEETKQKLRLATKEQMKNPEMK